MRTEFTYEKTHIDGDSITDAATWRGMLGFVDPCFRSEINGFSTIEATVEALMVATGKRDNKMARHLYARNNWDPCIFQTFWGDQSRLVPKEIGTTFKASMISSKHDYCHRW